MLSYIHDNIFLVHARLVCRCCCA